MICATLSNWKNGSFTSLAADWLSCTSTTEPFFNRRRDFEGDPPSIERDMRTILQARQFNDSTIVPLECPLVWARESNGFDCVRFLSVLSAVCVRS